MRYKHKTVIGKRPTNEDSHYLPTKKERVYHFGVFDGHGGGDVSKFVASRLIRVLKEDPTSMNRVKHYTDAFRKINDVLKRSKPRWSKQGSTAVVCAIRDRRLVVANTGDSRGVLCRSGLAIPLSKDHKPDSFEEAKRIEALGGKVVERHDTARIEGLSVSRAFGDFDCSPYVICDPDVVKMTLRKSDQFIILACDGLWDVVNNQAAVDEVMRGALGTAPARLIDMAIRMGTTDNVSVVVIWDFEVA